MFEITPDWALALWVAASSLFFDYFPGVAAWFESLAIEYKRLITLGASVLVVAGAFAGTCLGWWATNLTCEPTGIVKLLIDLVLAVAVMYGFHAQTKPSANTKAKMFK